MMTRSSAYRSSQGTPARNSSDKASSTMMKSKGLSTDPWWTPTFTSNSLLSRWFKNTIFAKKCILISFWIFEYCFYYSFIIYYCAIFYSLDAGFFKTIQMSNSLDPDQARYYVGPDLGPNWLQRLSADIAGKELNT